MNGWMDGWMGWWMDGLVDGWMDGWVDGWMGTALLPKMGLCMMQDFVEWNSSKPTYWYTLPMF